MAGELIPPHFDGRSDLSFDMRLQQQARVLVQFSCPPPCGMLFRGTLLWQLQYRRTDASKQKKLVRFLFLSNASLEAT